MTETNPIGTRLRTARNAAGIDELALANRCGWTGSDANKRRRVRRYESGERDPGTDDVVDLAAALATSPTWLLTGVDDPALEATTGDADIAHLPLADVHPDPDQPRREFDDDAISELADSLRAHGILQPIVVRKVEDIVTPNRHVIVCGERRWRAAHKAELATIPCIIRNDISDDDRAALQIVENLQRVNLSLAEIVRGVSALCADRDNAEVARMLGRSRSWVSRRNQIATGLREEIRDAVIDGHITDADIAHDLNTLWEFDEHYAKGELKCWRGESGQEPDSRDTLRRHIKWARERRQQEAEFQERRRQAEEAAERRQQQSGTEDAEARAQAEHEAQERQAALDRERERREQLHAIADQTADTLEAHAGKGRAGVEVPFFALYRHMDDNGNWQTPADAWQVNLTVHSQAELNDLIAVLKQHWQPARAEADDAKPAAA